MTMTKFSKKTFFIPVKDSNGEMGKVEVTGWYFEVEGLSFMAHKDHIRHSAWKISEYSTGLLTGSFYGCTSRKKALETFLNTYNRLGKDKIINCINRHIEKYGILNH